MFKEVAMEGGMVKGGEEEGRESEYNGERRSSIKRRRQRNCWTQKR